VSVQAAALLYGGLAVVAIIWRWVADGEWPLWTAGAPGGSPSHWAGQAALGLAIGLLLVHVSRLWTRRTRSGAALEQALREVLGQPSAGQVAALALLSGLAEEMFFRGALQPRVGWLWASLVFGLAHFVPRRDLWPWAVYAAAAGLIFAGLFEWTGNLLAPVVAHVSINGLNLRWMARRFAAAAAAGTAG